ncbi:hypothetical protein [Stackebrandtia soli]|uniref:hypothetical protein n=1 Tax=Stackebrandtia soli TaxID=1892856 RepID=UPI0039ECD192
MLSIAGRANRDTKQAAATGGRQITLADVPDPKEPVFGTEEWDAGAWTNPVLAAPVVYVVGGISYMTGIGWGWPAIAGAVLTASFAGAAINRGIKKLGVMYTSASVLAATAWTTYAARVPTFDIFDLGGTTLTHLIALGVITLPLLVVWSMLVRDAGRARVTAYQKARAVEARRDAWSESLAAAGVKGWTLQKESKSEIAVSALMRIAPGGTTFADARSRRDALDIAFRAPFPGAVRVERPQGIKDVSIVLITKALKSAFAEPIPMPPVVDEPRSILDPLDDGLHEDGEVGARVHAYQTVATIGRRDAGKSGLTNVRIDRYLSCKDVILWGVDFKKGRFTAPWLAPYAVGDVEAPAFDWVVSTPQAVRDMVDALHRIGDHRAEHGSGDKVAVSAATPAIRLIIDEIADLTGNHAFAEVARRLARVVSKLRSEGIDIDFATQRGTGSFLGDVGRDLLSQSTIVDLLQVDSATEIYNAITVPSATLEFVDPTRFEEAGTVVTLAKKARMAARRAYYLTTDAIPARSAQYSTWRPVLEPGAAAAAGPAYARRWSTPEARALLVKAARDAGRDFAPRHATNPPTAADRQEEPAREHATTATTTTTSTTATAPTATEGDDLGLRDDLIDDHGNTDGNRKYVLILGRMILHAARSIMDDRGATALPTRDLIDALAVIDPDKFGDLTPKSLAAAVKHYGVSSTQLGGAKNPKGYRRADIAEGINRSPDDA